MLEIVSLDDVEQSKRQICVWISSQIEGKGWSQREASRQLGLALPKINQICRGRDMRGLSLEKLLSVAEKLGEVRITIKSVK